MRVIVCGSRKWKDADAIEQRLKEFPRGTVIIHGDSIGADKMAGLIGMRLGFVVHAYPAAWHRYGKEAGLVRNLQMLDTGPDLVLAFWLDGSTGTGHMISAARRRKIPVEVRSDPEIVHAEELFVE